MERELLITGMGGQGVQLAAQVIARGATLESRHVMLFACTAARCGMNTDGTVVVGDAAAGPTARLAHVVGDRHARRSGPRGAQGAYRRARARQRGDVRAAARRRALPVPRPATDIAPARQRARGQWSSSGPTWGSPAVGLDATVEAMRQSIPPYRRQHIAANEVAIRAGFDAVEHLAFPAWEQETARA